MSKANNIIIGAGISGLSCARVLKDCLVLEKEPYVGGLSNTIEFNGFRFDLGGHRFFTHNKRIENFVKELLRDQMLEVKRRSKIYKNKKFIEYPLQVSVIFQLNPWQSGLSFLTYLYRKVKPLYELSFKERAINRFGDYLYKLFFRDYTQKMWGVPCDKISKELVDVRLQNISLTRVIKYAFKKDGKTKSFIDKFIYPKEGICMIAESLAKNLDIRLNSKITGLVYSKNKIDKVIVNNSGEFECNNLISTMPITELVEFFDSIDEIKEAARNLRYRSLILVFLILNRKKFTDNHWIYFPDGQIFGRLHEPKNWSAAMAPQDKTGVCIEIFSDSNNEVWKMSDTEIAHQVIKDLPLVDKFEIVDYFVKRVEYAYPIYDVNYRLNLSKIENFLSSYKNLYLLGRTGSFRYINMDACIEEGLNLGHCLKIDK